jgi:hypothetical protein
MMMMAMAQNRIKIYNLSTENYDKIDPSPISSPAVSSPTILLSYTNTNDKNEINSALQAVQDENVPPLLVAFDYSGLYERQAMLQQALTHKN